MTLGQTLLEPNLKFPLSLKQNTGKSTLRVIFHSVSILYSTAFLQYRTMSNPFPKSKITYNPFGHEVNYFLTV